MEKGGFCHLEIPASDPEGLFQFYKKVFGWTKQTSFNMGENSYLIFQEPCGLGGGMTNEQLSPSEAGILLYMAVEDIEPALRLIEENGGKVIKPKTLITEEFGYYAHFLDPQGNTMGLWAPYSLTPDMKGIGGICWFEIPTTNPNTLSSFYSKVLNWQIKRMEGIDAVEFTTPMKQGGMFESTLKPSTPGIVLYIAVDDIDEQLKQAELEGAKIIMTKTKISDEYGYMGSCIDPQGNHIGVWSLT